MKTHEIKIAPRYFSDVISGKKTFECRINDRDYKIGDMLILLEWMPGVGCTGRKTQKQICYVFGGGVFGIEKGYCVIGMEDASTIDTVKRGKWLDTRYYAPTAYGQIDYLKCSVCETLIAIDDSDNYCPHCGAKMENE